MKERERRLDKDGRARRREREAGHGDEDQQGRKLVCGRAWKEEGDVRKKTGEKSVER